MNKKQIKIINELSTIGKIVQYIGFLLFAFSTYFLIINPGITGEDINIVPIIFVYIFIFPIIYVGMNLASIDITYDSKSITTALKRFNYFWFTFTAIWAIIAMQIVLFYFLGASKIVFGILGL